MKIFGVLMIVVAALIAVIMIYDGVTVSYNYNKKIGSYWELADKSSTIEAKSEYIDKFIEALKKEDLEGHNALIFKTPDNDITLNIDAVKTLQKRLHEIKKLKSDSFEYNQAIQQITAQEQGEAHKITNVIFKGWMLHCGYWIIWEWIGAVFAFIAIVLGIGGSIVISIANDI